MLPSPANVGGTLKFGFGNAKLSRLIGTFSIPAGHTCPFADICLSRADKVTGRIQDGPNTEFRCFAASAESAYSTVRRMRWHNFELLKSAKTVQNMADLIQRSLPDGITTIRVHVSGDFYSESYFLAWVNVAVANPGIKFYGYTKALVWLVKYKTQLPENFRFTASKGGKQDSLIGEHNLKYAEVVYSMEEAREKNLQIDHDDSLAMYSNRSFALLLHGTQPLKSKASEAWEVLKNNGIGGYSPKRKREQVAVVSVPILVDGRHNAYKYIPHA